MLPAIGAKSSRMPSRSRVPSSPYVPDAVSASVNGTPPETAYATTTSAGCAVPAIAVIAYSFASGRVRTSW